MRKPSLKKTILLSSVIGVFMLVAYNTKDLFFGAPFAVHTAVDGATVTDSFLPIKGVAKHASALEINGRVVAMDKTGTFSDGVVLSPGYNIIEISQRDRFGKEKTKVVHLVAEPTSSVATAVVIHY